MRSNWALVFLLIIGVGVLVWYSKPKQSEPLPSPSPQIIIQPDQPKPKIFSDEPDVPMPLPEPYEPEVPIELYEPEVETPLPPWDPPKPDPAEDHGWSLKNIWQQHKKKLIAAGALTAAAGAGLALYKFGTRNGPQSNTSEYTMEDALAEQGYAAEREESERKKLAWGIKKELKERDFQAQVRALDDQRAKADAATTLQAAIRAKQGLRAYDKMLDQQADEYNEMDLERKSKASAVTNLQAAIRARLTRDKYNPPAKRQKTQYYDAEEPDDDIFYDAPPVLTRREKEMAWEKDARETNKRLNVGAWLAALQPQKWEPPPSTSYDSLWDRDNIDTWG